MSLDIFGHQPMAFGDAMSADQAVLLFAGPNGWSEAGILSTNLMLNYTQPVMRIYDFGAPAVQIPASQYFIIGHPQGQGNIGQVVGPRPINYCFYMAFGDACGVQDNNFLVACGAGCSSANAGNFAFYVNNCLLQSFGFQVAAQDMLFSANLPFMFVSLGVPDQAAAFCIAADSVGLNDLNKGDFVASANSLLSNNKSNSQTVNSNNSTKVSFGDFIAPS